MKVSSAPTPGHRRAQVANVRTTADLSPAFHGIAGRCRSRGLPAARSAAKPELKPEVTRARRSMCGRVRSAAGRGSRIGSQLRSGEWLGEKLSLGSSFERLGRTRLCVVRRPSTSESRGLEREPRLWCGGTGGTAGSVLRISVMVGDPNETTIRAKPSLLAAKAQEIPLRELPDCGDGRCSVIDEGAEPAVVRRGLPWLLVPGSRSHDGSDEGWTATFGPGRVGLAIHEPGGSVPVRQGGFFFAWEPRADGRGFFRSAFDRRTGPGRDAKRAASKFAERMHDNTILHPHTPGRC